MVCWVWSHSSSVTCNMWEKCPAAALLTTMSTPANSALTASAVLSQVSRKPTSPSTTTTRRPSAFTPATVSSRAGFRKVARMRSAPSRAKVREMALPFPGPIPVTTATFPTKRPIVYLQFRIRITSSTLERAFGQPADDASLDEDVRDDQRERRQHDVGENQVPAEALHRTRGERIERERQRGACWPRQQEGGEKEVAPDRDQEDDAADEQHRRQQREDDEEEYLQPIGAVHAGRVLDIGGRGADEARREKHDYAHSRADQHQNVAQRRAVEMQIPQHIYRRDQRGRDQNRERDHVIAELHELRSAAPEAPGGRSPDQHHGEDGGNADQEAVRQRPQVIPLHQNRRIVVDEGPDAGEAEVQRSGFACLFERIDQHQPDRHDDPWNRKDAQARVASQGPGTAGAHAHTSRRLR